MGRNKLSNEERKRRGTYQPSRALTMPTGTTLAAIPDPPDDLGDQGAEMWYRVCHYLHEKQRLTAVGLPQIARYCVWHEIYISAISEAHNEPVMTYNESNAGVSAYLKAAKEAIGQMIVFEREWGLTPKADRQLPQPDGTEENDPFALT